MTAMRRTKPTPPPTPAPMPIAFELSAPSPVVVGVGEPPEVLGDAVCDAVKLVGVSPNDVFALDAKDGVGVVLALVGLALVEAPTSAPASVKTAFSVLQHLCLSASLSQQYLASSAYPWLPHCHTCTPFVRKSYALELLGVSWFS